jgi:histone-lysine N-methyltransferase SETDB1
VPVPCVNCVDHSLPDYVAYWTKREATVGVNLNLDPQFLVGCECTDDCQVRNADRCYSFLGLECFR